MLDQVAQFSKLVVCGQKRSLALARLPVIDVCLQCWRLKTRRIVLIEHSPSELAVEHILAPAHTLGMPMLQRAHNSERPPTTPSRS
jgi:hypothetical protein